MVDAPRPGETPGVRGLLALGVVVLPLAVVFFGYHYGLEAAQTVNACGACHVMTPYVRDLRDPGSDALAALHFKNRYIQENHCYFCHTDYGMSGLCRRSGRGSDTRAATRRGPTVYRSRSLTRFGTRSAWIVTENPRNIPRSTMRRRGAVPLPERCLALTVMDRRIGRRVRRPDD